MQKKYDAGFRRVHSHLGILLAITMTLTACDRESASPITDHFLASGRNSIDLTLAVSGNWDRVCILGPYSRDSEAAETLGFQWPVETLTNISYSDGVSLLIFVQDKSVINYVEHPRNNGDFSYLTGRCFLNGSAKFVRAAQPLND